MTLDARCFIIALHFGKLQFNIQTPSRADNDFDWCPFISNANKAMNAFLIGYVLGLIARANGDKIQHN